MLHGTPLPPHDAAIVPENVDRLQELARWGKGRLTRAQWSRDGRVLVVGSDVGFYVYDGLTFELSRFIATGDEWGRPALSPDGKVVAAVLASGEVRLWSTADGLVLRTLDTSMLRGSDVVFAPDGQTVYTEGDAIRRWRVADGALLKTLPAAGVDLLAVAADGRTVITTDGMETTVEVWDAEQGVLLRTFHVEAAPVFGIALSPDGTTAAVGTPDDYIYLWGVADGKSRGKLQGRSSWFDAISWSADGQLLAAASAGGQIEVWRTAGGALVQHLPGHQGEVESLAFSPDGRRLLSAGRDDAVRLWRISDGAQLRTLEDFTSPASVLAFSADGRHLLTGARLLRAVVRVWDTASGAITQADRVHLPPIFEGDAPGCSFAFAPDGASFARQCMAGDIQVIRVADGAATRAWSLRNPRTRGGVPLAFSPDGQLVAAVTDQHSVSLWRVSDGALLATLEGAPDPSGTHDGLRFSPDQAFLAGWNEDVAQLWRVDNGLLARQFTKSEGPLAFSADGRYVAVPVSEGSIAVRQLADGAAVALLSGAAGDLNGLALSPDGQLMAASSGVGGLYIWRVADGALLRRLLHTACDSVAFSPDGTLLAAGSYDGVIHLWSVRP